MLLPIGWRHDAGVRRVALAAESGPFLREDRDCLPRSRSGPRDCPPARHARPSSCCAIAPRNTCAFRGSAHEYSTLDPADLEAAIGRIVVVAHVFRDRERPYRRVDATAQADRDLILGLEPPFQIRGLLREH